MILKFYSSLTGKKISNKRYEHVFKVWNKFEIKKMKDYHDLYLRCNVFEKFRNNSIKIYELCSNYYFSAPALSWDAMVNMTKAEFEHIFNADTHLLFDISM